MAALTFPLAADALMDLMMVETVTWSLGEDQELSGDGAGELLAADLGPRRWEASVSSVEGDKDSIEALRARFNMLDGAIGSFYLYDKPRPNPPSDPTGALLAGATVTISAIEDDRKRLTLAGLPAGFALTDGTLFSVTAGSPSRTALEQIGVGAIANGAGIASDIEVRPHLRPWIAAGQTATLLKPVAKMKLVPRSLAVVQLTAVTYRLRWSARQTLAAG